MILYTSRYCLPVLGVEAGAPPKPNPVNGADDTAAGAPNVSPVPGVKLAGAVAPRLYPPGAVEVGAAPKPPKAPKAGATGVAAPNPPNAGVGAKVAGVPKAAEPPEVVAPNPTGAEVVGVPKVRPPPVGAVDPKPKPVLACADDEAGVPKRPCNT